MQPTMHPSAPPAPPPPPPSSNPTTQTIFTVGRPQPPSAWSTGLCHCCDDVGNCCLTCLCPCVTFGRIAEVLDGGTTSCCGSGALYVAIMCLTGGWPCIYSCFYRSKLRGQHVLAESPCSDCLVHCCCELCALCQEYRELNNRGIDPKAGWQGRVVYVAPAVDGGMNR